MYGQNSTLPELACPEILDCDEHPADCRQIFDIYSNLDGSAPVDISGCFYHKFNSSLGFCNYLGEYQTLTMLLSGINEAGTDYSCLVPEGTTNGVRVPRLSLLSFPFGMNTPRTAAAELATGTHQRVLTIKEQLTHFNLLPNNQNLYMLSSIGFTNPPNNPASDQDNWVFSDNDDEKRVVVPHSVIKHTIYTYCGTEPIDSIAVIIDNTRGRASYYPFKDCNDYNEPCNTSNTEYDIAIVPFIQLNNSATMPSGFNYLNYFPLEEIPVCPAFSCMAWEGETFGALELCEYLHPTPYSLVGVHLQGTESASYALGYTVNDDGTELELQAGIKHTYIVDKNYDITQINPEERIFYNPSEVHIEADNLIFPSGYSFVTARGTPPTLTDIENTPCNMKNSIDQRYMPVITDQPNTTYTKTDETTVTVKPSVYILEPGSKLTIEPCVHLYDMTIVVKPGARLVYYPNQLYGNFDPETDIITDGTVSSGAIIEKEYEGLCHDCRCEQNFGIANGINIDTEIEWENEFLTVLGQIVVKPGGKLSIIDSELQFSDSQITGVPTGITVAPGGKLYLRNSKLTALNCHNMWDGIKIQGNDDLPQYPETNQGTLYIVGGVVEKARLAQSAGCEASVEGGGIIKAMNATFRNNDIALMAGVYLPNSASIFRNCIFEQTMPIKHILSPDPGTYGQTPSAFAQAVLIDSRGIKFVDCTFQNKRLVNKQSFDEQKGFGILTYMSDFYAGPDYWSVSAPPPPNPLSTQSVIRGFYKGIDTYGALGWDSRTTIWQTRFENNFYSYVGNGSNLDQITESKFYSDFHENESYFIFFHHAANYTVAGNIFEYTNPNSTSGFDGYGIHCHRTGLNNGGSVFSNVFRKLYQGVIVEGDNPSLEVKCNVFEDFLPNGTNDFRFPWILKAFTASNGTIIEPLNLGNQGTGCGEGQTAGNLFNDMGIDRIHIYATHEAQNSFTYFANGTPSETIPIINGYGYEIDEVFYNVADVITNQNCVNGVDDPTTCPVLPNLSGYPGGTSIGDGSPSDFAGHILTSNGSNTARVNRAARVTQHYLQNDSTRQEALVFLTAFDTPQAWHMLLGANLQHADTALIRHYLELLEDEPDSDPYLIDYYKILADVIADSRNLHQLQIAEIEALEDIARSASSAAVYAESLLAMPTLSTYIRQTLSIQISGKKPFNTVIAPVDSWLNPNPATQTITINTSKLWQYLTLYNLHGQAQITYHPSEQSQLALPEYLPNGLYIAKLVLTDGETQTVKILISK